MLSFQKLLKAQQISKDDLNNLFHQADIYKEKLANSEKIIDLQGKILASLFFEPSTRTRFSFESAMHRLGVVLFHLKMVLQAQLKKVRLLTILAKSLINMLT